MQKYTNELKMPQKPELRHQYGMLFNHQGYVMLGLQSLQLFLAGDLPKVEALYHEPPEFPNCSTWAASDPFTNTTVQKGLTTSNGLHTKK